MMTSVSRIQTIRLPVQISALHDPTVTGGLSKPLHFGAEKQAGASGGGKSWSKGMKEVIKTRFPRLHALLMKAIPSAAPDPKHLKTLEASLSALKREREQYYEEFSGFLDRLSGIEARDEIKVEHLDAGIRQARDAWAETVTRMLIPDEPWQELTEYEILELNQEANALRADMERAENTRDMYRDLNDNFSKGQSQADVYHRNTMRDFNQRIAVLEQEIAAARKLLKS